MADSDSTRAKLAINIMDGVGRKNFRENIGNIKNKAEYANRQDETSSVADGASVRVSDGKVNVASSQNTDMKFTNFQSILRSFEENHTANRINIDAYDIVINGHKLNPNLWEYADFKTFKDQNQTTHAIGGFCLFGTILTPSWDAQLKRYVLIRRLARMPMFSQKVNVPDILPELNIEDPTKVVFNYKDKQHTESADAFQKRIAKQIGDENNDKNSDTKDAKADDSNKGIDNSNNSSDNQSSQDSSDDKTSDSKKKEMQDLLSMTTMS